MTEIRSGTFGSAGTTALEEARRRAEAERGDALPTQRGQRDHGLYLLPHDDSELRAFVANASSQTRVPPAIGDLSLYTDDALEREIDTTRQRLVKRAGPEGDGDRLALDRLEGEAVRRHTPKLVDVNTLKTRVDLERAIEVEGDFLGTYGTRIQPPSLRGQHQQRSEIWNAGCKAWWRRRPRATRQRQSSCPRSATAQAVNRSLQT